MRGGCQEAPAGPSQREGSAAGDLEEWGEEPFRRALAAWRRWGGAEDLTPPPPGERWDEPHLLAWETEYLARLERAVEMRNYGSWTFHRLFAEVLWRSGGGGRMASCVKLPLPEIPALPENSFFAVVRRLDLEAVARGQAPPGLPATFRAEIMEKCYCKYVQPFEAHLRRVGRLPAGGPPRAGQRLGRPRLLFRRGKNSPEEGLLWAEVPASAEAAPSPPFPVWGAAGEDPEDSEDSDGEMDTEGPSGSEDTAQELPVAGREHPRPTAPPPRAVGGTPGGRGRGRGGGRGGRGKGRGGRLARIAPAAEIAQRPTLSPVRSREDPHKRSFERAFERPGSLPGLPKRRKGKVGRRSRAEYMALLDAVGFPPEHAYRRPAETPINLLPWIARTYSLPPLTSADVPEGAQALRHMLAWLRSAARDHQTAVPPNRHHMEVQFDPICRRLAHARVKLCVGPRASDRQYWLKGAWMPTKILFDGLPEPARRRGRTSAEGLFPKKESRVGAQFQAEVPEWGGPPPKTAAAVPRLEGVKLYPGARGAEPEALEFFGPGPLPFESSALSQGLGLGSMGIFDADGWKTLEHHLFAEGLRTSWKKDFAAIAQRIREGGGNKTVQQCVGYYYNVWKQGCSCTKRAPNKHCIFHGQPETSQSESGAGGGEGEGGGKGARGAGTADSGRAAAQNARQAKNANRISKHPERAPANVRPRALPVTLTAPSDVGEELEQQAAVRRQVGQLRETLEWLRGIGPCVDSIVVKGSRVRESRASMRLTRARQVLWGK